MNNCIILTNVFIDEIDLNKNCQAFETYSQIKLILNFDSIFFNN